MNDPLSEIIERQKQKRRAELHALDGCREDMSDVKFSLEPPKGTAKAVLALLGLTALLVLIFFIKRLPSRSVGIGSGKAGPMLALIAVMAAAILLMIFFDSKKARLSVEGKIIYYKDKAFRAKDISLVKIDKAGYIKIFSGNDIVLKASYADENSEKLIAWAKKCGIALSDERTPFEELYGEPLDPEAEKTDRAVQIIKKYRS